MTFDVPSKSVRQAHVRVSLKILRELLRLPADVEILAVRPHPNDATQCLVEIAGDSLPSTGELIANHKYEHTTVVKFTGWSKP